MDLGIDFDLARPQMVRLRKVDFSLANPWIYFGILLVSNSLLSYSSFSYLAKSWILFFGVLIPFILSLATIGPSRVNRWRRENFKLSGERNLWLVLGTMVVFLRFFKLTSFHLCPTGDEALHGFLSIPLSEKWNWQFFYTVGEHPPLLIWVLSLFFKIFDSPFFNLWFFPSLISALTVPMGYLASRQFISKSTA